MTLTTFIRFSKIIYSALIPQAFYYIGFFCLWLLGFQVIVLIRHLGIFFVQVTTIINSDFGFIGLDSDIFMITGHYRDSVYDPYHLFVKTHQPQLRFHIWSVYYNPEIKYYGNEFYNLSFEEIIQEKDRLLKLKKNNNRVSHDYFFLTTELFGKVKVSSYYKWIYYGMDGGQYAYWDTFEDMIVDPTLSNNPTRYSVEFMRYNLAFFFNDPIVARQTHFKEEENDDNYVAETISYSFIGYLFLNSMRNDFSMVCADYFLFRHNDENLTQHEDEDINTAYHIFINVPRCLDFAKNDGLFYRLFEQIHDDFFKGSSQEENFFLMEHFGESDFVYDDIYIDSIEDDELGGTWDFATSLDLEIYTGQDYDDTIWGLRWDPAIDYALSNVIKGSTLYKYTKFVHIDHMKNYHGGMV